MIPDFGAQLRVAPAPLIAEVKPNSPKAGALLAERSVAAIAADYAAAGAPCLSVTTGKWHHGSLDMIGLMSATGLPVLRKDFIVSARHIEETRAAGGAAVLLTCALLRTRDVWRLAEWALGAGLTPFVEAADAAELEGLELPEGAILAINNRNIRDKEMDNGAIERSLSLYDAAREKHRGLLVSASGMLSPGDVRAARKRGYDGVLVGTALLSSSDGVKKATRSFLDAAQLA